MEQVDEPRYTGAPEGRTLLYAEDDPAIRKIVTRILEREGYTVLVAEDGVEALTVYEEHGEQVDLALLDVKMPRMPGDEAYRRMQSRDGRLKAIFVTAFCDFALLDQDATVLQKPVSRRALLEAVRLALAGPTRA